MASVTEQELAKSVRSGEIQRAYYFYGRDVGTLELYTKRLAAKLVPKGQDTYNMHFFAGKELDLSQLTDCAEQLPMFAERVCILVNDFNAEDWPADRLTLLTDCIKNLPETTTVVFYMTGLDVCSGKKYPTPKNKKIADAVSKAGIVCEFAEKKPHELAKSIISKVEKAGCSISKPDAEYLAGLCLCDMVLLGNELSKLTAYAGAGAITRREIDLLVSRQLDSNSFMLAKAAAMFDASQAMRLLDELFAQKIEPVAILSALAMSFNDLYRARIAMNEGKGQSQVTEDFHYKSNRSFAVRNAFRDAARMSTEHLRFCMRTLAQTDAALKSTGADGRLLIEKAIAEMASARG